LTLTISVVVKINLFNERRKEKEGLYDQEQEVIT
jgi:hypothetical protein